jgi:hypothetical protein
MDSLMSGQFNEPPVMAEGAIIPERWVGRANAKDNSALRLVELPKEVVAQNDLL